MEKIVIPLVLAGILLFFGYKDVKMVRSYASDAGTKPSYNKWYWILGLGFLLWSFIQYRNDQQEKAFAELRRLYPPSPEQLREEKIKKLFSTYDGSNDKLVEAVKRSMNDPESFDHVETGYTDRGETTIEVSMKFRGKNAFNATVLNQAKGHVNVNTGNLISWDLVK